MEKDGEQQIYPINAYDYMNTLLSTQSVVIILVIVLVLYFILFMSLDTNKTYDGNSDVNSSGSSILLLLFVLCFAFLLVVNGFQYLLGINIIAKIKNVFSQTPEIDIAVDASRFIPPVPEIILQKQVFNIPGNQYEYPDAKALCTAYGARLATYSEVENAYNHGGEWCNYGWSDGQMALFPTQKATFDKLQTIEGHQHDCGRPGVNGGYMANPALKFGVNCYGYKPQMTSTEEELMATEPLYPKTKQDIAIEKRVNYWKEKLNDVLVSPFNTNSWSKL